MQTLVRYARSDQFPPGTDLRQAARDSVIRYCRHFGLNFRWLHDQSGQWWNVKTRRPLPGVYGWRSEVELVDQQRMARTCTVCGEPSDAAECTACVIAADITYTRSVDQ